MEYYTFKVLKFAGIDDVIFSTTGYTGSGGCEIYIRNADAPRLWEEVFRAGEEFGIKPIGLAPGIPSVWRWDSAFMEMI
jgi:aminomethyltransferase